MAGEGDRVEAALAALRARASPATLAGYPRYGIVAPKAFGVAMGDIQAVAKALGRDHDLAQALWATGWYEARLLCAYVDDPKRVTAAQMDRWARDFDNWAVCDTLCFSLFDRTAEAWEMVGRWAGDEAEFVRRAGFALLAGLALHGKRLPDSRFLAAFPLIEAAANDPRNFVRKGVSWALRSIGGRSPAANAASVALARRLADSPDPTGRWIGKDALRDITRPAKLQKLAERAARSPATGAATAKTGKEPT